jgi:ribosome-associated protein
MPGNAASAVGQMSRRQFDISDLTPWIEFAFERSAGPGGQNVNKVSTRAVLLFDFAACPLLSSADKARIRQRLRNRLTRDGRLRVVSQGERSQVRNRAAAEERLLELLASALYVAPRRRPTVPTAGSRERRLRGKRLRSATKQRRSPPAEDQ